MIKNQRCVTRKTLDETIFLSGTKIFFILDAKKGRQLLQSGSALNTMASKLPKSTNLKPVHIREVDK
jgi:hypothetical protein